MKLPLQLVIWSLMEEEAANYAIKVLENIHTKHTKCTLGQKQLWPYQFQGPQNSFYMCLKEPALFNTF